MQTLTAVLEILGAYKDGSLALAAFIGVAASILGAWITSLRQDLSDLMQRPATGIDGEPQHTNMLEARIRLRLTSKNTSHQLLDLAVARFRDAFEGANQDLNNAHAELISCSRRVLKEAWGQAARGH